jgi:ribose 5-phosphate isomerase B
MYQGPLFIASDHAGHKLKNRIIRFVENELNLKIKDMGAHEYDELDDFPDYIIPASKEAIKKNGRAILICGSANGSCIVANKVKGMRAAIGYNIEAAELARKHNDANGLCLAARVLTEDHAIAIVKKWLETDEFLGGKYAKRNDKITEIE